MPRYHRSDPTPIGPTAMPFIASIRLALTPTHTLQHTLLATQTSTAFDSKWVPPAGGAPSRHTGTGGAADGVHGQYLRDSGAGDRSRVAPRSKQLGKQAARRGDVEQSKQLGKQPGEAMSSSRGDARAAKRARTGTGGAKTAPPTRSTDLTTKSVRLVVDF
jgi:hypothetical protein